MSCKEIVRWSKENQVFIMQTVLVAWHTELLLRKPFQPFFASWLRHQKSGMKDHRMEYSIHLKSLKIRITRTSLTRRKCSCGSFHGRLMEGHTNSDSDTVWRFCHACYRRVGAAWWYLNTYANVSPSYFLLLHSHCISILRSCPTYSILHPTSKPGASRTTKEDTQPAPKNPRNLHDSQRPDDSREHMGAQPRICSWKQKYAINLGNLWLDGQRMEVPLEDQQTHANKCKKRVCETCTRKAS